jgi:hypothetical protein
MSLQFDLLVTQPTVVYSDSCTHNLSPMAKAAGLYWILWGVADMYREFKASEILPTLEQGLQILRNDPETFRSFNAPNGWGTYEDLLTFVSGVINACKSHPEAIIRVGV